MTTAPIHALPAAKRRRLIIIGLLRASAATAALVAVYYLLPLDHLAGVPLGVSLAVGLVALTAMTAYQVRAIIRAPYPAVRAIEALAVTGPLFLLLYADTYVLMLRPMPGNFNVHTLTKTDSLYFTVTVFTTVGFGESDCLTIWASATACLVRWKNTSWLSISPRIRKHIEPNRFSA